MLRLVTLFCFCASGFALDNGLALTPPMGWLSWERFRCNTDCANDPDNCISERLYKQMADIMANEGYKDVGYESVGVDDCWLEKQRDAQGKLQPDHLRFPHGIKHLADYIHARGLKFGIYEDYGNLTCAGYPGIIDHMEQDANTFAEWEVDYVKLDGCYADPATMDEGYPKMGKFLNSTGRPMVYSCSWPDYQRATGMKPNYKLISEHCNLWRNFDDIDDSWTSVLSIIDYYGNNQDDLIPFAGPGHWNDPDMLIIGNFGLSYEQSKAQMAMWAILASPLLISADLRAIAPEYKAILQNRKVIWVNQDPLGRQGRRIYQKSSVEIWRREVTPLLQNYTSYAVAFLNRRTDGMPYTLTFSFQKIGLTYSAGYHVTDLFSNKDYGTFFPSSNFTVRINPTGVVILRAEINQGIPEVNLNNF